jgi:drug/metabolite transporter (DMT)-like permease
MFVGGNWLIAVAQKSLPSGQASVLVATTPLWMALLELAWPWGDRLTWLGWLGLAAGLGGVVVLMPQANDLSSFAANPAPLLVLGSAFSWAVGSFILRHRPKSKSPRLAVAAWQMILGGGAMSLIGLSLGEASQVTLDKFTLPAVYAYFHLLVFGSLIGFIAFLWLLDHVSAALAGTYAYVNPVIAVFLGCWIAQEALTWPMVVGMLIVLSSVGLVRAGVRRSSPELEAQKNEERLETVSKRPSVGEELVP